MYYSGKTNNVLSVDSLLYKVRCPLSKDRAGT